MSDINTYADEAAIAGLSPINGDLVLNQADSSLYLCINADATGINRWKKFANDAALAVYQNRWGASFDGSNDHLSFSDTLGIPSSTSVTVSCWINCSNTNANQHVFGTDTKVLSAEIWGLGGNNIFYVEMGNSKFASLSSMSSYITQGSWHHIAVAYDGSGSANADKIKLYIDGQLMTLTFNGIIDSTMPSFSNFYFGKGVYNVYYNGLLDEAAIFNSALSAADITKIYNSGVPTNLTEAASYDTDRTSNLKGYWRMGDDSNDSPSSDPTSNSIATITDSSGNGNGATQSDVTKQPTFADLTGETIYI